MFRSAVVDAHQIRRLVGVGYLIGKRSAAGGFLRETFSLPREEARAKAKAFLKADPKAAYMSEVERWRELPDGRTEFTMRRLSTAD